MTVALAGLFDRLPAGTEAAGSLTSLAPDRRTPASRVLSRAGLWTHIDVMEPGFAGRHGIPLEALPNLVAGSHRADVHLMVDHPDEWLAAVLSSRPQRVTAHVERLADPARTAEVIRFGGAAPWLAIAPGTDFRRVIEAARYFDGVLVMLVTPGSADSADLEQLQMLRDLTRDFTVGVDGGVNSANLSVILGAGASYVVAGRSLLVSCED